MTTFDDRTPEDDELCPMCAGDGIVELSECGPSEWGEDTFCDVDRLVACPECRNREKYEELRKQQLTPQEIEREEVDAYWEDNGNFGVDAGTETKAKETE